MSIEIITGVGYFLIVCLNLLLALRNKKANSFMRVVTYANSVIYTMLLLVLISGKEAPTYMNQIIFGVQSFFLVGLLYTWYQLRKQKS